MECSHHQPLLYLSTSFTATFIKTLMDGKADRRWQTHISNPPTFDTTSNSLCFNVKKTYKPIVPYVSGSFDVHDVWILGPCFGVFCFGLNCHNMDKPFMIALRNIATGETKEVPLNFGKNTGKVRYNFGFGCVVDNSSVPEFKIVSLEFVSGGISSHVYTSTTNTCKSVEPPCGSITLEHGTTELNGVCHWMAKGIRPVDDQFILTFDLKKEFFGRIEIPDETFDAILIKQDDQYLSLIYSSNGVINIWVMRDSKSWVKQARVVHDNNGMISCYLHSVGRLLTQVRCEQDTKIVMSTELFDYVESLVSFNY